MKTLKITGAVMAMASPIGCMAGNTAASAVGIVLFLGGLVLFVIGRLAE